MKTVNIYVIEMLFNFLNFLQIDYGGTIDFLEFDPDDGEEIERITILYLVPELALFPKENRDIIRWTIEYAAATGDVPFDDMRRRFQDWYMDDPADWQQFFRTMGSALFELRFETDIDSSQYHQDNNERKSLWIFSRSDLSRFR